MFSGVFAFRSSGCRRNIGKPAETESYEPTGRRPGAISFHGRNRVPRMARGVGSFGIEK